YGITTPYTSYLIVPDGPVPVVRGGMERGAGQPHYGFGGGGAGYVPPALAPAGPAGAAKPVSDLLRTVNEKDGDLGKARSSRAEAELAQSASKAGSANGKQVLQEARDKKQAYDRARELLKRHDQEGVQGGKLGVDLSIQTNNLRNQYRLEATASRNI